MSEKTTLTCDVCGKDRAEVNGWWSYRTGEREFHAGHADGKKGRYHACGHNCLHKALDAYLTSQAAQTVAPTPDPTPQPEPQPQEEPESLVRGKGLNVADIVAEQGGTEPVFEGSKVVEFDSGPKLVAVYEPLPCDPDEMVNTQEPVIDLIPAGVEKEKSNADDRQIEIPFEERTKPGEPEKRE